ncbi:site-2 protease family protein [Methanobrevibacter curvatus]|uniref:Peptidase family M50 n=1 Tax=Methanobrevibacter curvatus TaxID=49547 RepID=A0A166C0H5_9EURY|nr:site-2 protease family protein [Methanobrevibacter curvatus]KZX10347.1 peptidase family M50 [Methanobrevibacter curvatus]
MNGIYYYLIAFILIWAFALIFRKFLNKFGVKLSFPMLMWRTNRFNKFIDKLANISPKFWKWYMNIGVVVSFIGMILICYMLIVSLNTLTTAPSVSLVLPGVEVPGSPIFIPFASGIFAMACLIIVHEFGHGIIARVSKIDIKSVGLFLLAILPGAFVEPDDEEIEKLDKPAKMRIFAAGSIGNLSFALICILVLSFIGSVAIPANFHEEGVLIHNVAENSPSSNILKDNMLIKEINGKDINTAEDFTNTLKTLKPNDEAIISTNQGVFHVNLSSNPANPSIGFLGVFIQSKLSVNKDVSNIWGNSIPWIWFYLTEIFYWLLLLNISVGLFNLLPIRGLDGGHLLRSLLEFKLPKTFVNPIMNILSSVFIVIIVFSLIYSLISGFV